MTTKVQMNCIKNMVKKGNVELAVKFACMSNLQPHGKGLFVYEARMTAEEAGLTPTQFAGGLSALTTKGYYEPSQDPEFKGQYGYWKDIDKE